MAIIVEAAIRHGVMEGLCRPLLTPINKPSIPKNDLVVLNSFEETSLTKVAISNLTNVSIGILLALQAGLRIGEVCGLRWSDLDFDKNIIHIRQTISRVPSAMDGQKTMLILDSPKTPSSIRDIPMPKSLRNALLEAQNKRVSQFVVSTNNSFVGTRTFDHQYRQFLKNHNLQTVRFHTLRHTYATRCAEYGMDAKTLSQILGHASPNTSLSIYVHPSLDMAMQCIERIYSSH